VALRREWSKVGNNFFVTVEYDADLDHLSEISEPDGLLCADCGESADLSGDWLDWAENHNCGEKEQA